MEAIKQHALKKGVPVYVKNPEGNSHQFLTTSNQVKVVEKEISKTQFINF